MLFLWKIYIFQQSHFWVHFDLSTMGRKHWFLIELLLTGYCSFCKFLSSDLPICDLYSFEIYLRFKECHFSANFHRFRPLKIRFFQMEIFVIKQTSFKQFLFDVLRAEERIHINSLVFHILKSRCKHLAIRRRHFTFVL